MGKDAKANNGTSHHRVRWRVVSGGLDDGEKLARPRRHTPFVPYGLNQPFPPERILSWAYAIAHQFLQYKHRNYHPTLADDLAQDACVFILEHPQYMIKQGLQYGVRNAYRREQRQTGQACGKNANITYIMMTLDHLEQKESGEDD
jgi:hypothetical protein